MNLIRRRHALGLAIVGLALLAPVVFAGTLPETDPAKVGLSAERLNRITQAMKDDYASGEISGAVALVARHGKIAYFQSVGMGDREENVPMKNDTIFRIYSMSKPITSVAVMMLYEEGKFFLNDPVSKYLPEFSNMRVAVQPEETRDGPVFNLPEDDPAEKPRTPTTLADITTEPARREMTIEDLLRHTSGLTYGFFGNSEVDMLYQQMGILTTEKTIGETVEKLGKIPLKHHPGEVWEYSVSVDVLGRLVEVLSGQPFDEFLEERIFEPLGMVDTGFWVPAAKLDRFAQMYSPVPNKPGEITPAPAFYSRNFVNDPTHFSGGGGLVATAADYFRFCQAMLNGGELDGARLLSRTTVELMTDNHTLDIESSLRAGGYEFGLGFAVATEPGRVGVPVSRGEFNWGGAAGTKFWVDPDEEFIGVYMVQILPHTGLHFGDQFKILAYQSIVD
jgi:CubicO group peptidase (beta-lactamase class C family)